MNEKIKFYAKLDSVIDKKSLVWSFLLLILISGLALYFFEGGTTGRAVEGNNPGADDSVLGSITNLVCNENQCNPEDIKEICINNAWSSCLGDKVCSAGECAIPRSKKLLVGRGGGIVDTSSSSPSPSAESVKTSNLGEINGSVIQEMEKREHLLFEINGNEHELILSDSSEISAVILSDNAEQSLMVGEEKSIDFNSDGSSDVLLRLQSINILSGKAKLVISIL